MTEEVSPKLRWLQSRKAKRLVLLVAVPAVLVLASVVVYMKGGRFVETDNAFVKADVLPVSAEISGVVDHVFVRANEPVQANQVLFTIDSQPFEVAVEKAEANLARVKTELDALRTSYQEKEAQIELARSNYQFAVRELERQKNLKGKNFVSASTMDDLQHAVDQAKRQLGVVKLDLQKIAASLGGGPDRPLEQHPTYRAALADLEEARLNLRRVEIRASAPGIVSKAPLVGQYIRAGNMITSLVATDGVWIEANFTETDLTHVRPGQTVNVHIDTYPEEKWQGRVESISPATGAEFSIIPAQNATGNWVKVPQRVPVRIRLDPQDDAPPLRAGLSAVVEIDTQHQRQLLGMSF